MEFRTNITFDEVQSQLENSGKTLDSMDLDELVKIVNAAGQGQVFQNVASASSSSSNAVTTPGNLNLNQTLSRITADEVWKEIVEQEQENAGNGGWSFQRQPTTLGENTIEDFLFRAGAFNVGNQEGGVVDDAQQLVATDSMVSAASQQPDWLQLQKAALLQQQQQQMTVLHSNMSPLPVFGTSAVDFGYHENQLALSRPMPMPMPLVVAPPSAEFQAAVDRKRWLSDDIMKKNIERRQKRMIKNRESAARSRERKQAYLKQLQNNVENLKITNERLKKEKEFGILFPCAPEPRYQLRRTSSAPF